MQEMGQSPSLTNKRLVHCSSQSLPFTLRTLPRVLGARPRRLLGVRGGLPWSICVSACFLFFSCCVKVRSNSGKSQQGNRSGMGAEAGPEISCQSEYPELKRAAVSYPFCSQPRALVATGLLTRDHLPSSQMGFTDSLLLGFLSPQSMRLPLFCYTLRQVLSIYHKGLRMLLFPLFNPCFQLFFQWRPETRTYSLLQIFGVKPKKK